MYARRRETRWHGRSLEILTSFAQGTHPWAIFWPCVYEFLRVVAHPRVFDPPTDLDVALEDLASLFGSPSLILLGEGATHSAHLERIVRGGRVVGNLVHDAHIAALAIEHGVRELWTADRDFARFPGLRVHNPFVGH